MIVHSSGGFLFQRSISTTASIDINFGHEAEKKRLGSGSCDGSLDHDEDGCNRRRDNDACDEAGIATNQVIGEEAGDKRPDQTEDQITYQPTTVFGASDQTRKPTCRQTNDNPANESHVFTHFTNDMTPIQFAGIVSIFDTSYTQMRCHQLFQSER